MRRQVLISLLVLLSAAPAFPKGEATGTVNWSAFAFSGPSTSLGMVSTSNHLVQERTTLYKPGEVVVRFNDAARPPTSVPIVGPLTKQAIRIAISDYIVSGATVRKEYDRAVPGLVVVKLPQGTTVVDALIRFNRSANVLYAEPNYKYKFFVVPNDPNFSRQWALNNTGQGGGTPDADIDAPEAWDIQTGSSDVIVAVIDSGVDYDHPDLAGNMWTNEDELNGIPGVDDDDNGYVDDIYGYDFLNDDGDPADDMFHGTHCAGIIGAETNNARGVAGVCWDVSIMTLKVGDLYGVDLDAAIEAIGYAVDMGARVINASWGSYEDSQGLRDAIAGARMEGVLFVAAAGDEYNDNDQYPMYPASYNYDNIISVMATDNSDGMSFYSNYGATSVDIGAPGMDVLSTLPTYRTLAMNLWGLPTNYGMLSGTSVSAPHVSGACALVWSQYQTAPYRLIKSLLFKTAEPKLAGLCLTGGRLNLYNALELIPSGKLGKVLNTRYDPNNTSKLYSTIQAAINDANNGDTLIAEANSLFIETIDFKGKTITLRSGNIKKPSDPNISPKDTIILGIMGDDSVVRFGSNEGAGTILKGFTISWGSADYGGGIECDHASPTITDCIITDNFAAYFGAGIDCYGAFPTIKNCTVTNNETSTGSGVGGGINCEDGSPAISNCLISHNFADNVGGGIACYYANPSIFSCIIANNWSLYESGEIDLEYSSPTITNCTIVVDDVNIPKSIGIFAYYDSRPSIKNCILWGNGDDLYGCSATYSCIEDNDGGTGNIHLDPLFATGPLGDYYLSQTLAGQLKDSNCVDGGDPDMTGLLRARLLALTTRTDGVKDTGRVDIGAHYAPMAAKYFTLKVTVVGGNGYVDPNSGTYPQYAIVRLKAHPDPNYRVEAWTGTDDDTSTEPNNTVKIIADANVTVAFEPIPYYTLRTSIIGGHGTITPYHRRGEKYPEGTVVPLVATPDPGYIVEQWTDTDDDGSWANTNSVTMDADKNVTVTFRQTRVLHVPGQYASIQMAINAAYSHGDKIIVSAGTYPGGYVVDRTVAIASEHPDDPCCVAATIILTGPQMLGDQGVPAFTFTGGQRRDAVIDGFTLLGIGDPGPIDPWRNDEDEGGGMDGPSVFGGAISCLNGSGPTLSHLVIRDVVGRGVRGQDAGYVFDPPDDPPDRLDPLDALDQLPDPEPPEPYIVITKWLQAPIPYSVALPDYFEGWNEENQQFPPVRSAVADDFLCDSRLPLTRIRWWGSFRNYTQAAVPTTDPNSFRITIWANKLSDPIYDFNHPDVEQGALYQILIPYANVAVDPCGWEIDPNDPTDPNRIRKFIFDCMLDPNWSQPGDSGIYWLSIEAIYNQAPPGQQWGWETRKLNPDFPQGGGAVRFRQDPIGGSLSFEHIEFAGTPWDMCFELLYATDPNAPADGVDGNDGQPGFPGLFGRDGNPGMNGYHGGNGGSVYGGALYFDGNSSPLILNVTIINCHAVGGDGGFGGQGQDGQDGQDGQNGQPGQPGQNGGPGINGGAQGAGGNGGAGGDGGNGGWGGDGGGGGDGGDGGEALGGAVWFGPDCRPTIRYLKILNCSTKQGLGNDAGNAGDGGDGGDNGTGATGGTGGTGTPAGVAGPAGVDGVGGNGGRGGGVYFGGYGGNMGSNGARSWAGAIFYGVNCQATVSDAIISYNSTSTVAPLHSYAGGDAGDGGNGGNVGGNGGAGGNGGYGDPEGTGGTGGNGGQDGADGPDGADGFVYSSYTTGYGGGNYYDVNCAATLTNCTISYNTTISSSTTEFYIFDGGGEDHKSSNTAILNRCNFTGNSGSNGGGQCFDQTCTVEVNDCNYASNLAYSSGGGLYCWFDCSLDIKDSTFAGNISQGLYGYGGGVHWGDVMMGGSGATVRRSYFVGNEAGYGGGLHWNGQDANVAIIESVINNNKANHGGGLYFSEGAPKITGCTIIGNEAGRRSVPLVYLGYGTYYDDLGYETLFGGGGGISCWSSAAEIEDCFISGNSATGSGGGVYFGGDPVAQLLRNCLVKGNSAVLDGGGIVSYWYSVPTISNCTIVDNSVYDPLNPNSGRGGGLSCSYESSTTLIDSILWGNTGARGRQIAIGSESDPVYISRPATLTVSYCDIAGGQGDVYVEPGRTLNWLNGNINTNPLFVVPYYYLSQVAAGQGANSPCVNAGSDLAANLGLGNYSTASNGINDTGKVDMGLHYPTAAGQCRLTVNVVGKHGTVQPSGGLFSKYAVVTLTAIVDPGYRIRWIGSDDDLSNALINTVTMYSDRTVTAIIEQPTIIKVPGDYPLIQAAVNAAKDGDVIVVNKGRYYGGGIVVPGKAITITSTNPDDPCTVAATIIDGQGYVRPGIIFSGGCGPDTILNGLTIANCSWSVTTVVSPSDPGQDGYDGGDTFGAGIYIEYGAGPTIVNCTITDCYIRAGNASSGNAGGAQGSLLDSDDPGSVLAVGQKGGNGGNGGSAYGAGIWCGSYSRPIIRHCTISNCQIVGATAGNAGEGGGGGDGGVAGNGGNGGIGGGAYGGGIYVGPSGRPRIEDCNIVNCSATAGDAGDAGNGGAATGNSGVGGNGGVGGESGRAYGGGIYFASNAIADVCNCWFINCSTVAGDAGDGGDYGTAPNLWGLAGFGGGYLGEYWKNSAYGGGVYCGTESKITFENCAFSDNTVEGGMSGVGGMGRATWTMPRFSYVIPSYGAGAFCDTSSVPAFLGCQISGNYAVDVNDPNTPTLPAYRLDPYISYGGGICYIDAGSATITDCDFVDNFATVGGGLYWDDVNTVISDTNFVNNTAFKGGGIYSTDSPAATITRCLIAGNWAIEPGGEGGGIHFASVPMLIKDSEIRYNYATYSGGGVYASGSDSGPAELTNCLITHNEAGRDGAGVSGDWYNELVVSNCTITKNTLTTMDSYGAGLYCSYGSSAEIIDSIIWDNRASNGSQVGVASGDARYPVTSGVWITYSDIGPRYEPNVFVAPIIIDSYEGGSPPGGPGTVLVDGQNIYGQFDAGQERVKVIVSVPEPAELKAVTNWDSTESVARFRDEVARRQSAVLSTLTGDEFTLRYRYQNQTGFAGEITRAGLEKLLSNPLVAHIEPVRRVELMLRQAIPLANALSARQAYDGRGVAIAIVDTGIDYTHPMLGGGGFPNSKVIGGYDTGNNDPDPMPVGVAHGTCCAGIAAGSLGNVGDYIGGVAPGAKLYALKASPDNASYFLTDALLAAWDWCVTHRNDNPKYPIKAMSNSWGFYGLPFDDHGRADAFSPAFTAAADTAVAAGITVMAASGNDGFPGYGLSWPSAMSKVISVGAVNDTTDQVMWYSDTAEILDIFAPADPVYTTDIVGAAGYNPGDYEPAFNGTSSACPFAAGCVADIQTAARAKIGRYLTVAEVKSLLIATGDPVTDTKVAITRPRVNLGNAIAGFAGPPIYIEKGCELNDWSAPDTNNYWGWDNTRWPSSNNIEEDPNFISGYYLSQFATNQVVESNCVNGGSDLAIALGMDKYTTRIDGVNDVSIVDMGYHYRWGVPKYQIRAIVVEDLNDPGIHGTVEPNVGWYYEGTKVTLKAKANDARHYLKGWYDVNGFLLSIEKNFEIVVDSNEVFIVKFRLPKKIQVSGGGDAIGRAISTAENGDTLIVASGTYDGGINFQGKDLKMFSTNPDDPNVVVRTIIDCQLNGRGFTFNPGADANTVINGFTIINGSTTDEPGGAIYIDSNSSPIIANVIINNCEAFLDDGGAIFVGTNSRPSFRNVTISNCTAWYGNGGGVWVDANSTATFEDCIITNCLAYGGSGGAVYGNTDSNTVFIDCSFTDNAASFNGGALCHGVGSESKVDRCIFTDNVVDSGGGGGICYTMDCVAEVLDCNFVGNSVSGNGGGIVCYLNNSITVTDCNFTGNQAGYGGGLYFDPNCSGAISSTVLVRNEADEDGGAIYFIEVSDLTIADCNISYNTALRGAGVFSVDSVESTITNCLIRYNQAHRLIEYQTDPNDPSSVVTVEDDTVTSQGGGIFSFAGPRLIANTEISHNSAGTSGGGIYLAAGEENLTTIKNCLLSYNTAVRDGGGISSNWQNRLAVTNCTITDNTGGAFGGGLYVSYESNVEVNDSIIWRSVSNKGAQIAVCSGDPAYPLPSTVKVTYTDVGPYFDPRNMRRAGYVPVGVSPVLTVTPTGDPTTLVNTILGPGIEVSNVSYTGVSNAAGIFTGGVATGLGMESGVILTCGDARLAPGLNPNQPGVNASDFAGVVNGLAGDLDLTALIPGYLTYDATVLEFDFTSRGGNLFFNFVFASDEYNEFVNGPFNDVFGFFLDGRNIAMIPGTNTAVSINNVNGGNPFGQNASHPEFFHNNDPSDLAGAAGYPFEYDGFTSVFTAQALNIGSGVHHIKLAVADAGDMVLDSAVFLQYGSFSDIRPFYPPIYVEGGCILQGWEPNEPNDPFSWDPNCWDPNTYTLGEDPNFVTGPLGDYYLSQIGAGHLQLIDSPCVDVGSGLASALGMDKFTTRTDLRPDAKIVDLGYHYPLTGPKQELVLIVVGPGTVVADPNGWLDPNNPLYDPSNKVYTYKQYRNAIVRLTAMPAGGYRVKSWGGTDNDPSWNKNTNMVIMDGNKVVRVEFERAITRNILVPVEYGTIEEAVAAAGQGGTNIIVSRGVHYVSDPDGIDFQGKSITLMSTDTDDPDVIATTIIDCQGSRYIPRRAFHFHSGEDPNTVVKGLTIRNGYMRGPMGAAGRYGVLTPIPYEPIGPNANDPPRAERGSNATGDGYGGGILCENASSPTIKNCVITNCTVTGAQGGNGALGQYPFILAPITDNWFYLPPGTTDVQQNSNGQWGGHAGVGTGNGYGGAIACRGGSSPVIIGCTIKDNIARGGCGGDGGNGGSTSGGQESWGGNGGNAIGDGIGGGIYCESRSIPVIIDCNFTNSIASTGVPGPGGSIGGGSSLNPRAQNGASGVTIPRGRIAGGAAYYGIGSDANFVGCIFFGNSAYEFYPAAYTFYGLDVYMYTRGGALYSVADNTVALKGCTFIGNLGGAVFIELRSIVDVNGCLFEDNEVRERTSAYNYYNLFYLFYPGYAPIVYETGGGAIYIGPDSNGVNIRNTDFHGNSAFYDGGAVSCESDANFINCLFGGNEASRNGGAIEAFYDSNDPNVDTTLALKLESCIFAGNKAAEGITGWGGAVHFQDFNATFTDCRFINNTARNGGGLFLAGGRHSGTVNMIGGIMHGNKAIGGSGINLNIGTSYAPYYYIGGPSSGWGWFGYGSYYYTPYEFDAFYNVYYGVGSGLDMRTSVDIGGGAVLADTHGRIENFTITDNVVEGIYGSGGAINFFGGYVTHVVKNCLITGNSSSVDGGAISANLFATPQIQNCDFNDNTAGELGGAIFCDWGSSPVVKDSIFRSCNSRAIAEEDFGYPQDPNVSIRYCLFYGNQNGDYGVYDSVTRNTSTRAGTELSVTNKAGDPRFATGPLGDYYLWQSPPQTPPNSPALNAGSGLAGSLGMDKYTTRIDGFKDTGTVDIGYHYADHRSLPRFNLTATVIGGHGSVEPASGMYYAGVPVTITAIPDKGWRVAKWTGTIDDDSTALTNVVIMGRDRTVTVEFGQPRHIVVGSDPNYTTIQHAIDAAADGDIVIIPTGTYTPAYPFPGLRINKGITLTSTNPDDPVCVRATVLSTYRLFITTIGSKAVIDGITIRSGGIDVYSCSPTIRNCIFTECRLRGSDGGNITTIADDGQNGVSLVGGAMIIYNGSPAIQNCAFTDCWVIGGDGGPGDNGTSAHPVGFDGGWAGWAYGGAAYIGFGSNPTFQDCSFTNCYAQGGNGGNGGDAASPPPLAQGGRGGNWEWADSIETGPFTYPYWYWWDGWQYAPYDASGAPRTSLTGYGYFKDYWKYSGYGGAVYIEVDSSPKFINCTFRNNHTYGGVCGIGGEPTVGAWGQIPDRNLNIENFGGAIYACNGSNPEFISCEIADNSADTSTVALPDDIMVSYGGGVAYEDDCSPKFVSCNIANNAACIGGGVYSSKSQITVEDSSFSDNDAYNGGGLYSVDTKGTVTGSIIAGNSAFVEGVQEPNYGPGRMIGQGGGYYCFSSVVEITDSILRANDANFSGGGIYIGGSDKDVVFSPLLHNCLLTANIAGRDGGGVSVNWNAEPTISNCTIADNKVTSVEGYGGGLYCSYDSNAVVIDSIIWDNIAINGSQVAAASGFEYEPRPSALRIIYTDIGPRYDPNAFAIPIITDLFADNLPPGGSSMVLVGGQEIYSQFDAGQERVKVIVSMPDPVELKAVTDWDSPVSVARFRGEIANRQSVVLSALTPSEFTLRYRYENLAGFAGEITRAGLQKLLSNPLVAHIEPVRYVECALAQSLPLANALDARQVYDGRGAAIAIIDTGVDYTHPMLGGSGFPNSKVIGGYDTGNNDPDPMPVEPHGTACAGIAAGNLGVVGDYIGGVAPGAKLYALKLTTDLGLWPTDSDLAAWDWCITHRNDDPKNPIKVMSNSWGIPAIPFNDRGLADAFSPAHTVLADTAVAAGITILAASHNQGYINGITWPSAMSKVISVGAVYDTTDQVTGYSNTDEILDILAPADPMYTTDIVGLGGYTSGDYYPFFNGTSSACPFAAGCVADIQTAAKAKIGRYLKPGEIKSLLIATGDLVSDWRVAITRPRVNLGRAIAIFLGLPGPPIYLEKGCELNDWQAPDTNNYRGWDNTRWPGSHNIEEDPNFICGYYISQVAAGQTPPNSPALNAGSGPASNLGMDKYTTRVDGVNDVGVVDMGYHYRRAVPKYEIRVIVIEDPNYPGIHGTVEPNSGWYYEGTKVTFRAKPNRGYYLKGWYDVNDILLSGDENFEIVVDSNEVFIVRFRLPLKIQVSGGGDAIGRAVSTAENGDTLIVGAGTYNGGINLRGKHIELVCTNPDDPNVIAMTIIDCAAAGRGFIFNTGEDADTVVDGFTIIDGNVVGENGGGIYVDSNSSPTIVNVVISNCVANNGQGGGIFVNDGSKATFINCTVINCTADAGGGAFCDGNSAPIFDLCTFRNNSADFGGGMYFGNNCMPDVNECIFSGNVASQDGGGLFCGSDSAAAITDCNFAGNSAVRGAGAYCERRSATTVAGSIFIDNTAATDGGAMYWVDANMLIVDSNIVYNSAIRGGGLWCDASGETAIIGCTIGFNQAGPRMDEPNNPNDPNATTMGQGGGMYCFGTPVLLRDCIINHNVANTSGGGVYLSGDSNSPQLANCLIINNSSGRDGGGVSVNWYARPYISNCTFAGNATTGYFGVPGNTGLGGGLYCSYHSNSAVIDSIFWNNFGVKGFEIAVATGFEPDPRPAMLTVSYSDVKGSWPGVQVDEGCVLSWGAGNIDTDPLFAGGMFGGYYLSQTAVGDPNQTKNSPCVDAGSDFAGNLEMIRYTTPTGEMVGYTTRTDGELERGKVDMGYHYRTAEPCRFCDLVLDGIINFYDFAKLASSWLHQGCSDADGWCQGGDLTFDRSVNLDDLAYFAECWLVADTEAPIPNPSEWEIEPYLTSSSSIEMIARIAFDAWGWDVQYYFDCVYGNCHDSGWRSDRTYQDSGLKTDARYGYRVKARDQIGNETDWSVIRYAGVLDTTPPAPAPAWDPPPYPLPPPLGQTQIAMGATVSYDDSGVNYGFWNVTRDPAGNNIVWQGGQQFIDVNLDPNTTYCYRVKARDGSANQNETGWSVMACATTLLPVDITPPTPNPAQWDQVLDANGYNGRPRKVNIGGGPSDYYATMRAVQATDPPDNSGVEYRFVCDNDGRFSSQWQSQPAFPTPWTYTVQLGGQYVYTEWYVIVRDQSTNRNQTGPSETWPALVRAPP